MESQRSVVHQGGLDRESDEGAVRALARVCLLACVRVWGAVCIVLCVYVCGMWGVCVCEVSPRHA